MSGRLNRVVQSFWMGRRLSAMEQLSIQSFIANGHAFHLYCYEPVDGVPAATVVKDAAEILPRDDVFAYQDGFARDSYAAFSNFFRYKLLLERGGWWVDTDVVCLRPFDLDDERVLATEQTDSPQGLIVSASVIKAPVDDLLMSWAWRKCCEMDKKAIRFGQIGPRLLAHGVNVLGLHAFMRPHTFFSPVAFGDWAKLVDSYQPPVLGPEVYGLHLWNQMWAAAGLDKDGTFPADCLYQQLRRRFAIGG